MFDVVPQNQSMDLVVLLVLMKLVGVVAAGIVGLLVVAVGMAGCSFVVVLAVG